MKHVIEDKYFFPPEKETRDSRKFVNRRPVLREELKKFQRLPRVHNGCILFSDAFETNELSRQ